MEKAGANELLRLREENEDIALLLDAYGELDRLYNDTLEAMGVTARPTLTVRNSSEVTVSIHDEVTSVPRG